MHVRPRVVIQDSVLMIESQMVSGLAITHIPITSMLHGSLMVDSTDFRTGGNENTASIIQTVGVTRETSEKGAT